jgi:hypothetical protein
MLSRVTVVVVTCVAIAMLCVASLPFHRSAEPSSLLELNGMVGGQVRHLARAFLCHFPRHALLQMAHLTVVGPLHEGLVPVVGTVGDQRVHGRISLSKIQNPAPIPAAAQVPFSCNFSKPQTSDSALFQILSPNYDAPIHLHVIIHPNGQVEGMPVALKDAASATILRALINKFGGSAHAVVLDGDLRRYPQVKDCAAH